MRESKTMEWKEHMSDSFLKTVSAYANYTDGEIKFGIANDGTIKGITNPDVFCLTIENKINNSIVPVPEYSLHVDKKNSVITLSVEEGEKKPYLYHGKAFRRSDTATVEVDQEELKRLILSGSNLSFEQLPSEDQNLTFQTLGAALSEKLGIAKLSEDILKTLGLFSNRKQLNQAALLLADQNHFPGIDLARFGDSVNEIMDREMVSSCSVLEQYERATIFFRRYYQHEKIEGMERTLRELVPETAFREAVANAIVHREWDRKAPIQIAMYPDRIEIISPGGLPRGLTKEEYLRGNISNLRNPILCNVFFRLGYVEIFGTGIRRIRESYRDQLLGPKFEVYENSVIVTLPVLTARLSLSLEEEHLYRILSAGGQMTSSELAKEAMFSKSKTIRLLKALLQKNYIHMAGAGRGTRYTV